MQGDTSCTNTCFFPTLYLSSSCQRPGGGHRHFSRELSGPQQPCHTHSTVMQGKHVPASLLPVAAVVAARCPIHQITNPRSHDCLATPTKAGSLSRYSAISLCLGWRPSQDLCATPAPSSPRHHAVLDLQPGASDGHAGGEVQSQQLTRRLATVPLPSQTSSMRSCTKPPCDFAPLSTAQYVSLQ